MPHPVYVHMTKVMDKIKIVVGLKQILLRDELHIKLKWSFAIFTYLVDMDMCSLSPPTDEKSTPSFFPLRSPNSVFNIL